MAPQLRIAGRPYHVGQRHAAVGTGSHIVRAGCARVASNGHGARRGVRPLSRLAGGSSARSGACSESDAHPRTGTETRASINMGMLSHAVTLRPRGRRRLRSGRCGARCALHCSARGVGLWWSHAVSVRSGPAAMRVVCICLLWGEHLRACRVARRANNAQK